MYTITEQYDKALHIYLSSGNTSASSDHVFALITEHALWSTIDSQILRLVKLDTDAAIDMLVTHMETLPLPLVVSQMESAAPECLQMYLHKVFINRMGEYNTEDYALYHEKQVRVFISSRIAILKQ